MLNHSPLPTSPRPAANAIDTGRPPVFTPVFGLTFDGDWCVGSEPVRWDVPFTIRLVKELKRFFRRRELVSRDVGALPADTTEPHAPIRLGPAVGERARRAA